MAEKTIKLIDCIKEGKFKTQPIWNKGELELTNKRIKFTRKGKVDLNIPLSKIVNSQEFHPCKIEISYKENNKIIKVVFAHRKVSFDDLSLVRLVTKSPIGSKSIWRRWVDAIEKQQDKL